MSFSTEDVRFNRKGKTASFKQKVWGLLNWQKRMAKSIQANSHIGLNTAWMTADPDWHSSFTLEQRMQIINIRNSLMDLKLQAAHVLEQIDKLNRLPKIPTPSRMKWLADRKERIAGLRLKAVEPR